MSDFDELTVGDQTLRAYLRIPHHARAGVVVLHAWWGLNDDVVAYGDRLADQGFAVLAPDMFRGQVVAEPEDAERFSGEFEASGVDDVAWAAVDRLAERLGPDAPLAALGWSFGAAYAIWGPSVRPRLRATVAYYGAWTAPFIAHATAPLLGHFAEEDPYTSEGEIRDLEEAYRAAGREITTYRYPGTGHWFAEPSRDAYRAAAAELAFDRTIKFLRGVLEGD
jgi:carboxymethylenebutenolidase